MDKYIHSMKKNRIVFAGCVETGFFCAKRMLQAGIVPTAIVSLDKYSADKNSVSGFKDLFELPVEAVRYRPSTYSMKTDSDIAFFKEGAFDILVILGWQRLIPAEILSCLRICGLTIHGSGPGLPKGRGRSPLNWAIIEGWEKFHISLLTMGEGADSGKILDTKTFDILPCDDIKTLYYKNAICSSDMLIANIPRLASGEVYGSEQDEAKATYYPKRTREDGHIDWTCGAAEIESLVRAVAPPYPGAYTTLNGTEVKFLRAQLFDRHILGNESPGVVAAVFSDGSFIVKTGDCYLLVLEWDGPSPKDGDIFE